MIREEINLRSLITKRLIEAYRNDPEKVAIICDTGLDRSGNILGWIRDLNQILRQNEKKSSEDNSELGTCPCCHAPAVKKTTPPKIVEFENDSGYNERSTLPGTSTYRYIGLSDGTLLRPRTIDTKSVIELQSTIVHLENIIQRDYLELLHTRRKIANQKEALSTLQANHDKVKLENDKLWKVVEAQKVIEEVNLGYYLSKVIPSDEIMKKFKEAISISIETLKELSETSHVRRSRQSEN